ncbi:hypothetical protein DPMN_054109 [Dreissena polymorpha]|uniref:Uncharacterized protein n=1 Tax=Dreissena polymorpha TaxID=45954 RepID=A0A9D4CNC2_DREPO|nr:hypothetical protein DPMN_054109 [Dreissena polymorpha]
MHSVAVQRTSGSSDDGTRWISKRRPQKFPYPTEKSSRKSFAIYYCPGHDVHALAADRDLSCLAI